MTGTNRIGSLAAHAVVLAMLGATALLLAFASDVRTAGEPAVALSLPDRVGDWTGDDLLFCQNENCLRTYRAAEAPAGLVCAACQGRLEASWSLAERRLLPADTHLVKKVYRSPSASGAPLQVSIVISGAEQVSIHRPQMCLTGQGFDITRERTLPIPLEGRDPLKLRVLDVTRRYRAANGQMVEQPSFYAYWFAARGHETPSHWHRMFYAAWDRVVRGEASRWAYVSIGGSVSAENQVQREQLTRFVGALYPLIARGDPRSP